MTDPKAPGERDEQQEQEKWYERTRNQVLLVTGAFILWALILWMLLDWYIAPQTSTQKQSVIQTLVVFMGGAAFLFCFSFIARYLRVPHYGVIAVSFMVVVVLWVLVQPETANQRISFFQTVGGIVAGSALLFGLYFTAQTLQVNREGQITERFTRAFDQLGATDETTGKPRLEIRLGGIYALERIASDSPKRDYSTVMEVLTAYVRENASSRPTSTTTAEPGPRPTADIQAILDVLSRAQIRVPEEYRARLALHEVLIPGALLSNANLQDVNFFGSNLRGVYLEGANLKGANLTSAYLGQAYLVDADLTGAYFGAANLEGAYLDRANLNGATGITNEWLERGAQSLEGAIMPNGQKYEDWLKDKESSGKDVENE